MWLVSGGAVLLRLLDDLGDVVLTGGLHVPGVGGDTDLDAALGTVGDLLGGVCVAVDDDVADVPGPVLDVPVRGGVVAFVGKVIDLGSATVDLHGCPGHGSIEDGVELADLLVRLGVHGVGRVMVSEDDDDLRPGVLLDLGDDVDGGILVGGLSAGDVTGEPDGVLRANGVHDVAEDGGVVVEGGVESTGPGDLLVAEVNVCNHVISHAGECTWWCVPGQAGG